jgi:hypothetical protein
LSAFGRKRTWRVVFAAELDNCTWNFAIAVARSKHHMPVTATVTNCGSVVVLE